jgi:streptomycin 6-kinase
LSEPEFFTESLCGTLYKVRYQGEVSILKIYKDYGKLEETKGTELLKLCPPNIAVNVLQNNEDAVLLEYLSGLELKEWVAEGRDDKATQIAATMARRLHQVPMPNPKPNLPSLQEWFSALFDASLDTTHAYYQQLDAAASKAKNLLSDNVEPCLLHGDIHHENILLDAQRVPKFIDPKGIIGDPAYDVANMMRNPDLEGFEITKDRILRQAEIFSDILEIDKNRILEYGFVHAWLSCCWSWMDGQKDMRDSIETATLFYEIIG